jgi:hypothetical protein
LVSKLPSIHTLSDDPASCVVAGNAARIVKLSFKHCSSALVYKNMCLDPAKDPRLDRAPLRAALS